MISARSRKWLVRSNSSWLKFDSLQILEISVLLGDPSVFGRTRPESRMPAMARRPVFGVGDILRCSLDVDQVFHENRLLPLHKISN